MTTAPRYARLYASPVEVRELSRKAAVRKLTVSDYIRAVLGLPPWHWRKSSSDTFKGSPRANLNVRQVKIRLNEDEARELTDAAIAIDATDYDYIRTKLGLERIRDTRKRWGRVPKRKEGTP